MLRVFARKRRNSFVYKLQGSWSHASHVQRQSRITPDGVTLWRRDAGRGAAGRAAARADGHPALRGAGLAPPAAARLPADRLRRPRPRRVLPRAAGRLRVRATWSTTSRRCSTTSAIDRPRWSAARWAPRPAMAFALRAPRARGRAGADHARLRRRRRTGDVDDGAGTRWPTGSSAAAWTASWRPRSPPTPPSAGARRAPRPRASAWSATSTRAAVAEALRVVPRSTAWDGLEALEALEVPGADRGARATRPTTCHPLRDRARSTRELLPERRAGRGGGGQVAARLAGRAAVERDRRLPRARRLRPRRARCRAARSSRPPRRPPRSPGGAHREPLQAVLGRQLGQPREVRRLSSGSLGERRHRHQAGHGHGAALDEVRQLRRGRCPPSPSSPATFTWTSTSRGRVLLELRAAPTRRRASGSAARSGRRP